MANERRRRQDVIRGLVRAYQIRTQGQLMELLSELGYEATQATLSRDIKELGLKKGAQGAYVLPETYRLDQLAKTTVHGTRRAFNQVLVFSDPGSASSVAAALDAAQLDGVLGCIAGDDTVLVICEDVMQGENFQAMIDKIIS